MDIRQATESDWEFIWPIFRDVVATGNTYVFDPAIEKEDARDIWMGTGVTTYIALIDDKVVGTYIIKKNQPALGSHVANASYMVDPASHGKGIGRAMGEHSLIEATAMGFLAMQFNIVIATNTGAIRLWEKLGFSIVGTLPKVFAHRENGLTDAYVMHRFL